jgi:hypothetical protein
LDVCSIDIDKRLVARLGDVGRRRQLAGWIGPDPSAANWLLA